MTEIKHAQKKKKKKTCVTPLQKRQRKGGGQHSTQIEVTRLSYVFFFSHTYDVNE